MPINCCTDCTGELVVDAFTLHTPAYCITNLWPLIAGFAAYRGDDITIPGASGRLPAPRRVDESVYTVPLVVVGDCDSGGTPTTGSEISQLYTNLAAVKAAILPPAPPSTTRTATLTLPDGGGTLTAPVIIDKIREGIQRGGFLRCLLDVTVPQGALT